MQNLHYNLMARVLMLGTTETMKTTFQQVLIFYTMLCESSRWMKEGGCSV
jgi:hypothetical protein